MQDTPERVIALADAAEALPIARSSLAMLKTLTKPRLRYYSDPQSRRKNRHLYIAEEFIAWIQYHMPVRADQVEALRAAARDFIPGANDEVKTT